MTRQHATCPTCQRSGWFEASGEQRWPAAVAAAHGWPQVIMLWTCPHCHTTVTEMALLPSPRLCPRPEPI